jgi:hypothetical protein
VRCLIEMEDFINDVWEDREGRWVGYGQINTNQCTIGRVCI